MGGATHPQDGILWQVDGGVGHIVLARDGVGARANALDCAMAGQLAQAVQRAQDAAGAGSIGALLISARGAHFCAGGDIQEFAAAGVALKTLVAQLLEALHPAMESLARLPVPLLSAVQGSVAGAGIALALCADVVLAAPAMKLRGGYAAIGLSPDLGVSWWLARRVGSARAASILIANRPIPAQQCLQWGLVDELHPPEQLDAAARRLAAELAQLPQALVGIRGLCRQAPGHTLAQQLEKERAALLHCALSPAAQQRIRAFVQPHAN